LLSNAALVLSDSPDLLAMVRQEPRRLPAIVEELLPGVRLLPDGGARIPIGILRGWLRLPLELRA
jgi:hypothetical protein